MGSAGTGKTVLLRSAIQALRAAGQTVRVAAPTGLAAQHLEGTTLAKLLGLRLARSRDDLLQIDYHQAEENLIGVDVLAIDEISMASGDLLELVDLVLQEATGRRVPFGGLRLILCGDFLQLPAVRGYHEAPFRMPWAFEYPPYADFAALFLHQNMRQEREEEAAFLHEIRQGILTPAGKSRLKEMSQRKLKDPVWLYPRRKDVEAINMARLKSFPGQAYLYPTEVLGSHKQAACKGGVNQRVVPLLGSGGQVPIGEQVILKKGVPVIILTNDPQGAYVNGSQGRVVEAFRERVLVELRSGKVVSVPLHTWEIRGPTGENNNRIRGLPIQLGWAATIHRAQGMTLDSVATDLYRCFEKGQAYVALSRARSLEEVQINRVPDKIEIDEVALAYMNSLIGD